MRCKGKGSAGAGSRQGCRQDGQSPGAGAGRQLVPGRKGSARSSMRSLTFTLKAKGSSELGRDGIQVVFIEDQSAWALRKHLGAK